MSDKLKHGTTAWYKRQDRWRHNSFMGHARMMQTQCNAILASGTATMEAKKIAADICNLAVELGKALKTRRLT